MRDITPSINSYLARSGMTAKKNVARTLAWTVAERWQCTPSLAAYDGMASTSGRPQKAATVHCKRGGEGLKIKKRESNTRALILAQAKGEGD